jgi:hypothetical protein
MKAALVKTCRYAPPTNGKEVRRVNKVEKIVPVPSVVKAG